jgi:hypothetical protein
LLLKAATLSSFWRRCRFREKGWYTGRTAPGLWAVPSEKLAKGTMARKEYLRFLLLAGETSTQTQPQRNYFSQMNNIFCSPLLLYPLLFHKIFVNATWRFSQNLLTQPDLLQVSQA